LAFGAVAGFVAEAVDMGEMRAGAGHRRRAQLLYRLPSTKQPPTLKPVMG
jgi:hypothetical protein